ncbi:MAG: potassium channel family protein, partial [Planctomycetota bacterium]
MARKKTRHDWRLTMLRWLAGRRMGTLFLSLVLLIPVGTIGYMLIAGLPLVDALYQTMITLTTVGYGDLAESAAGRIFNIVFLTVGVGIFVVALSSLAAFLIEGRIREAIGR